MPTAAEDEAALRAERERVVRSKSFTPSRPSRFCRRRVSAVWVM